MGVVDVLEDIIEPAVPLGQLVAGENVYRFNLDKTDLEQMDGDTPYTIVTVGATAIPYVIECMMRYEPGTGSGDYSGLTSGDTIDLLVGSTVVASTASVGFLTSSTQIRRVRPTETAFTAVQGAALRIQASGDLSPLPDDCYLVVDVWVEEVFFS